MKRGEPRIRLLAMHDSKVCAIASEILSSLCQIYPTQEGREQLVTALLRRFDSGAPLLVDAVVLPFQYVLTLCEVIRMCHADDKGVDTEDRRC
jgi:hypothetical protein